MAEKYMVIAKDSEGNILDWDETVKGRAEWLAGEFRTRWPDAKVTVQKVLPIEEVWSSPPKIKDLTVRHLTSRG